MGGYGAVRETAGGTLSVAGTALALKGNGAAVIEADPDREFWMEVRRGLLLVTRAIERRYGIGGKP